MTIPHRLAQAVLASALQDFGLVASPKASHARGVMVDTSRRAQLRRLHDLRQMVEAGEFLLERTDDACRYWFAAAGVNLERFRERKDIDNLRAKLCARRTEAERLAGALMLGSRNIDHGGALAGFGHGQNQSIEHVYVSI